ncbi:hypothetical protein [Corynebacterium mayonis]|uniref:hypothetical protein n=1 Tax=Corynebacterium mayonis TaxID=3062461 RepID=UPI0031405D03
MATDFPVIAGRGQLARMIRQCLEDLAALNFLREFVWIDLDALESGMNQVVVVSPGRSARTQRLEQAMGLRNGSRTALTLLNVFGPDSLLSPAQANKVRTALINANAELSEHSNNLLFATVGEAFDGELPTFDGYRNLMVAPEDAASPGDATTIFYDPPQESGGLSFWVWAATSVASITGLWDGFEEAPVAKWESNPRARLVRAYTTVISSAAFEKALRERIFRTDPVPVPTVRDKDTKQFVTVATEHEKGSLAKEASEHFIQDYARETLLSTEAEARVTETRNETSGQASLRVFKRWGKNILVHPLTVLDAMKYSAGESLDATIQSTVYGYDSTTTVGRVTHYAEVNREVDRGSAYTSETMARELAPLWQHYRGIACTLIDASPYRISGSDELYVYNGTLQGKRRNDVGIVNSPSDVIPGPQEYFGASLSEQNRVRLSDTDFAPYDVRAAKEFEASLDQTSTHQDVLSVKHAFGRWRNRYDASFASQVGAGLEGLRQEQEQRRADSQAELERLRAMKMREQKNNALYNSMRWFGWVLFWSLLIVSLAWGFGAYRETGWLWVENLSGAPSRTRWWMFGAWFALWVITYLVQTLAESLSGIQVEEERFKLDSQIRTAQANLEAAEAALDRIEVGYQQFLSVSMLYGALLERPFGTLSHRESHRRNPTNQLPKSIRFAEIDPSDETTEELSKKYSKDVYKDGWMQRQIETRLREATEQLKNHASKPVHIDYNNVFAGEGKDARGHLDILARFVSSPEFMAQDRSEKVWQEIVRQIMSDDEQRQQIQPVSQIREGGFFHQEILSKADTNKQLHVVEDSHLLEATGLEGKGLGGGSITVHVGPTGATADDFAFTRTNRPQLQPDAADPTPDVDRFFGEGF